MLGPIARHTGIINDSRNYIYKDKWLTAVQRFANLPFSNANILEVGSGIHNPLGSSILSILRGAKLAVAVEPSKANSDHLEEAALLTLLAGQEELCSFSLQSSIFKNIKSLIQKNEVYYPIALADYGYLIKYFDTSIEDIIEPECFNVIHSNAVFENVMDLKQACKKLFNLTATGGMRVHRVDFIDHRFYSIEHPSDIDAFRWYMKGEEEANPDCNRLRVNEIISSFEFAGFEFKGLAEHWSKPLPNLVKSNLHDKYLRYSIDQLETTCATLLFKKS